jgi:hypothetical protein
MDHQEFLKIMGIAALCMIIVYYIAKCVHFQSSLIEGLEAASEPVAAPAQPGAASGAKEYAEIFKSLAVKTKDELLVGQYKADYENVIIELDNYCDVQMLKCLLDVKVGTNGPTSNQIGQALQTLTFYKNGRTALNDVMTFIDKQSTTTSSTSTSSLSTSSLF